MMRRQQHCLHPLRRAPHADTFAVFLFVLLACAATAVVVRRVDAASLEDYRARVLRATEVSEELHRAFDEEKDANSKEFTARETKILADMRAALPASEKLEGTSAGAFEVDNRWLHSELDMYAKIGADKREERDDSLYRIALRLRSLSTHLTEAANTAQGRARDKEAEKGRLNSILRRPEYNEQAAEDTALARFWRSVREWLSSLWPKSRPLNPGTAGAFALVARLFVFALIAAAVIFVIWKYGAQLLPRNRPKKKAGSDARVVLGERLAPGQTPADLIAEAESLARAGNLRGAIRKAYIAVLFELGERNILRLAAHKTNCDYLSAIRREHSGSGGTLYDDMQPLTYNYERHWYGFAPATESDWHDFRSRCRQLTQ